MDLKVRVTTPKKVNKNILSIIDLLSLEENDLFYIKYTKETNFKAEENNCHLNNLVKVKMEGGSIVYGWVFWEDDKRGFIEANFHSLWKSVSGELIDITPRVDRENRILFICDYDRCVELIRYKEKPAIRTFANLKMIMGLLIENPKPMVGIIQSELIDKYHLI